MVSGLTRHFLIILTEEFQFRYSDDKDEALIWYKETCESGISIHYWIAEMLKSHFNIPELFCDAIIESIDCDEIFSYIEDHTRDEREEETESDDETVVSGEKYF